MQTFDQMILIQNKGNKVNTKGMLLVYNTINLPLILKALLFSILANKFSHLYLKLC